MAAKRRYWGGRLPSAQLDTLNGNVHGLLGFDAGLLHALDAASPTARRAAARLAARRACEAAAPADLDWVAPALAALEAGRPLPPPFDDEQRVWELLDSDERVPPRVVLAGPPGRPRPQPRPRADGLRLIGVVDPVLDTQPPRLKVESTVAPIGPAGPTELSQPHVAVPAVFAAAGTDPLQAAVDAVFAAANAYGEDHRQLLDEIRLLLD